MFTKFYESKMPEEFKVSITTDRIDLYTANVLAHLHYKEHTVLPPFQNISLGRDFHYGSHTDVS